MRTHLFSKARVSVDGVATSGGKLVRIHGTSELGRWRAGLMRMIVAIRNWAWKE